MPKGCLCELCLYFALFAVKDFDRKGRKGKAQRSQRMRLRFWLLTPWSFCSSSFRCIYSRKKRRPAQLFRWVLIAKGFAYSHFRNRVHDPIEVRLTHGMDVGVRRGIQKVDGVRNSVFYRELHRVQVVTQCPAQ